MAEIVKQMQRDLSINDEVQMLYLCVSPQWLSLVKPEPYHSRTRLQVFEQHRHVIRLIAHLDDGMLDHAQDLPSICGGIPHPGNPTALMEPLGAYPPKCLFIYLFAAETCEWMRLSTCRCCSKTGRFASLIPLCTKLCPQWPLWRGSDRAPCGRCKQRHSHLKREVDAILQSLAIGRDSPLEQL
jgi:hypothetical protein